MSEDLIKRSDAIKAVEKRKAKIVYNYESNKWFNKMISEIEAIPSADRPSGEWMPSASAEWISPKADFYRCSICGKIVNLFQMLNYNFCPNCGARMEGADDE